MNENIEPQELTPETFDFANWLAGAYKPTRGSTVHQRGDLIAELDRVQEEIELAEAVPDDERSLSDPSPRRLRAKYAELAQKFHESGVFVKISGHTEAEQVEISKTLDAEIDKEIAEKFVFDPAREPVGEKDAQDKEPPVTGPKSKEALEYRYGRSKDLTYCLMADGLVSPVLTPEQLKQLHRTVGEAEFSRVAADYRMACASINEPDADFLPKPSTPDETAE